MLPTFDPFSHNSVLYRGAQTQLEQDDPSFFDVVGASMGYTYDPIIETISNAIEFRGQEDVNYRPLDDIQGYEFYRDDLMDAKQILSKNWGNRSYTSRVAEWLGWIARHWL